MGAEYCHYLIPRPNDFLPSAPHLASFFDQLITHRWLPSPTSPAFGKRNDHVNAMAYIAHQSHKRQPVQFPLTPKALEPLLQKNTRLTWEITNPPALDLKYPLAPTDRWIDLYSNLDEIYYSIVFEWSPNYIHRSDNCIQPEFPLHCTCGLDLEFEGDDEESVLGRNLFNNLIIDVANWPVKIVDGVTGEPNNVPGDATSRFALLIDCSKACPSKSHMHLHPDLTALFFNTFHCDAYELGDFY